MIYSENDQVIGTKPQEFVLDTGDLATKLDIHVFKQRILLLVAEDYPPTFLAAANREQMLERGFHSIGFETPITGFRFRTEATALETALVHWAAYG